MLQYWIDKIEDWAGKSGLRFFPQKFVICSKDKVLEKTIYNGYQLYPHWSFGKRYYRDKTLEENKFFFLPNELVINTNPCEAYLLESNSLIQNIVVAAHVYGHNDFFRNNFAFEKSGPETIDWRIKRGNAMIRKYIEESEIGSLKVEGLLTAAHSLMFTRTENGTMLDFILTHSRWLEPWERDILTFVKTLADHLWPQLLTKIMNEGWATYWHYRMLQEFEKELIEKNSLSDYVDAHLFHEAVIRLPGTISTINPYRVGLLTWQKIQQENGGDEGVLFKIRREKDDAAFLQDHFYGNNFIYDYFIKPGYVDRVIKKNPRLNHRDVLKPEDKNQTIKDFIRIVIKSKALSSIPLFKLDIQRGVASAPDLIVKHVFDGRYLDHWHTRGVIKLIQRIWRGTVIVLSRVPNKENTVSFMKYICFSQGKGIIEEKQC